jgi:hypothetical protein
MTLAFSYKYFHTSILINGQLNWKIWLDLTTAMIVVVFTGFIVWDLIYRIRETTTQFYSTSFGWMVA